MKNNLELVIERANELSGKALSPIQLDLVEIANHLLSNLCIQVKLEETKSGVVKYEARVGDDDKARFELGQQVQVAIYDPKDKEKLLGWQLCRVIGVIKSPLPGGSHQWLYKTTFGSFTDSNVRPGNYEG